MTMFRRLCAEELPANIPIFPLTGAVLLPGGHLPLTVFEPRYLAMVDRALSSDRTIGMIQPAVGKEKDHAEDQAPFYSVGCAGRLVNFSEMDDGRYRIALKGLIRFRVGAVELTPENFYMMAVDFSSFGDDVAEGRSASGVQGGEDLDRARFLSILSRYFEVQSLDVDWVAVERAPLDQLITALAMSCPFLPAEKQAILEAPSLAMRADVMEVIMEMALYPGSEA